MKLCKEKGIVTLESSLVSPVEENLWVFGNSCEDSSCCSGLPNGEVPVVEQIS